MIKTAKIDKKNQGKKTTDNKVNKDQSIKDGIVLMAIFVAFMIAAIVYGFIVYPRT